MGTTARHIKSALKTLLYFGVDGAAYRLHALLPVDEHKALFVEMHDTQPPNDFALVMDELESRGFSCDYACLHKGQGARYVASCVGMSWRAARARLLLLRDANMPVGCLPVRDETSVVQLWHACGAFKKFGLSTTQKIFGVGDDEMARFPHYGNTTLATVSSPEVVWAYEEAMGLEGQGAVQALGVSRTDALFDEERLAACRAQAEKAVPAIKDKRVLLWAPTFRGQVTAAEAPDTLDVAELRERLGQEWVLLVKHHPLVAERPSVPAGCEDFAFDVSDSLPIEAAMVASDACVSDYSSLVFEYSLLRRPMAFLAPDLADYDDWRGFYYDYDQMTPGPVLATTTELADWAAGLVPGACPPEVDAFRERFMCACDGHATARIVDSALGGQSPKLRGQPPEFRGLSPQCRYDVSVIVPVYNAEGHLGRCVASLDAQTARQDSFEVVLINDGSTDGSLALCRDLAATRSNYVVLDQPNQGVSAARNAGIRAARGRYIMFLDSDDWLSKGTIKALVSTFDRYADQIDLLALGVTYTIVETGATWRHKRDTWLTHTGVYPLDEYPHVAQSTPTVCIRNEGAQTPRFPTGMRMGEDQYFNTKVLARKGVLGYCAKARYYHVEHEGSSRWLWDAPKHSFEDMMRLYNTLLELAVNTPSMSVYAYSLILYNMGWRLRNDLLYPEFGDAATRERNHERLYGMLRQIPQASWEDSPYLVTAQRAELMRRAGLVDEPVASTHTTDNACVTFANGAQVRVGLPALAVRQVRRTRHVLQVCGLVYGPSLACGSQLELVWQVGSQQVAAHTCRKQVSYAEQGVDVDDAWWFEADLPAMGPYAAYPQATLDGAPVPAFAVRLDVPANNGKRITADVRLFGIQPLAALGDALYLGTLKGLPAWSAVWPRIACQLRKRLGVVAGRVAKLRPAGLPPTNSTATETE
ncbi:MAG: CDP-glycerol glycerophosphotransferase family protein [Coriobacteriales bacterium]|nr:CDP-glycerol glycerophosphotransferase family protein [Coriobacteriales bacterium]